MVVDLSREHSGFVDGVRNRRRLIALPLAPKTGPDQGGEWNDGGNHQGQKTRSNAPQHPLSPADRICLPTSGRCTVRGRADSWPIYRLVAKCLGETLFHPSCESGETPDLSEYNE
jgi:hypothetical protein